MKQNMKRKADEAEMKNISHNKIKLKIHESLRTCKHFGLVPFLCHPTVVRVVN